MAFGTPKLKHSKPGIRKEERSQNNSTVKLKSFSRKSLSKSVSLPPESTVSSPPKQLEMTSIYPIKTSLSIPFANKIRSLENLIMPSATTFHQSKTTSGALSLEFMGRMNGHQNFVNRTTSTKRSWSKPLLTALLKLLLNSYITEPVSLGESNARDNSVSRNSSTRNIKEFVLLQATPANPTIQRNASFLSFSKPKKKLRSNLLNLVRCILAQRFADSTFLIPTRTIS